MISDLRFVIFGRRKHGSQVGGIFIGVPLAPADAPLHMKNVHLKDMRNGPEPQRGDAGQPGAQALGTRAIAGEP